MRTKALVKAQKKYISKHYACLTRFNADDKYLLDYAKSKPSTNQYIKDLIRADYELNNWQKDIL